MSFPATTPRRTLLIYSTDPFLGGMFHLDNRRNGKNDGVCRYWTNRCRCSFNFAEYLLRNGLHVCSFLLLLKMKKGHSPERE